MRKKGNPNKGEPKLCRAFICDKDTCDFTSEKKVNFFGLENNNSRTLFEN